MKQAYLTRKASIVSEDDKDNIALANHILEIVNTQSTEILNAFTFSNFNPVMLEKLKTSTGKRKPKKN